MINYLQPNPFENYGTIFSGTTLCLDNSSTTHDFSDVEEIFPDEEIYMDAIDKVEYFCCKSLKLIVSRGGEKERGKKLVKRTPLNYDASSKIEKYKTFFGKKP